VIRIEITAAAYAALAASATRGFLEAHRSPTGGFFIWLDEATLNRLSASRRPSEGYSEAIIRLAGEDALA
jgi:hypothetical protein